MEVISLSFSLWLGLFFLDDETTPITAVCVNEYLGISANQNSLQRKIKYSIWVSCLHFGVVLCVGAHTLHVYVFKISTASIGPTFTFTNMYTKIT